MADAKAAVQFVLLQEDARLSGIITNRASDRGGLTRYGLTAKFHPELIEQGFFEESMSAEEALPIAEQTYEESYEKPLCLDSITSQPLANALLSFAVNEGNHQAVVLLQRAARVAEDGEMGPQTLAAVNANPTVLGTYCDFEANFYEQLVRAQPSQKDNLKGWLNRVNADRQKEVVEVEST